MKTYVATPATRERNWLVVDATGKTLGRLATQIADALRGMGVAFEGWWPASQQDLAAAVAANPNLRPLSFRLEDGPGAADAGAERVPSCGAGR